MVKFLPGVDIMHNEIYLQKPHLELLNYFCLFIQITQLLMGFDFPPLVVSNPLPPQTASHCTHQLFKVLATAPNYSSPHQTRSSGHANGGFLFSCLPSFGQPSSVMLLLLFFFFLFVKDYCGLFFFFLFFFSPPILFPVPPVCQSVILCASTKPSVLITW